MTAHPWPWNASSPEAGGFGDISYPGITLIGQQYAERYPYRVRALTLDSNMDHSLGTRRFMETEAESMQDSFDAFVGRCDRTPECALHGEDVRGLSADLLARADQGELTDPGDPDILLTSFDLITFAFFTFYGPDWFLLAELLAEFGAGDPQSTSLATALATAQQDEEIQYAFPAVLCQDWDLPIRDFREFDRQLRRMARSAPDVRYAPFGLIATTACLGWPSDVDNPQHRLRVRPGPKLLLANSLHDPVTGYNWATNAARQLGRSAVLLTYEGAGHGLYGRSDCVTGVFDEYLISVTSPEPGARCPAVDPEPFTTLRQPVLPAPSGPRPDVPGWLIGS